MSTEASTTTLLGAVNSVLLDAGERGVLNTSSPAASKAKRYLQEAVTEFALMHAWDFLIETNIAQSWSSNIADLGDIIRVYGVWSGTNGWAQANFINRDEFAFRVQSPTALTGTEYIARLWTQSGYGQCKVEPYPSDFSAQSVCFFKVHKNLLPPSADTDVFPVPEVYIPLLVLRALCKFAKNALDDSQLYGLSAREYKELLAFHRRANANSPTASFNMYRH